MVCDVGAHTTSSMIKFARGTQVPTRPFEESRLVELATNDIDGVVARMRGALAAISLELCLIDDTRSNDLARTLRRIGQDVATLERVSDELADLSVIAREALLLERSRVDVHALVEIVLAENLTPLERHRCVLLAPVPCPVELDRVRIERAVLALVTTALATSLRDEVTIRVDQRVGAVRVTVGDVATLASPGTAFDGSRRGIGMKLCRAVVEAHGGTVGTDERSASARLWIELPTQHGDVRQQVLVVDHDPGHVAAIAAALARQNMAVSIAESGSHALDLVRTRRLDVVVIATELPDVAVPDLVAQLRDSGPHLRIVSALTPALDVEAIVRECLPC